MIQLRYTAVHKVYLGLTANNTMRRVEKILQFTQTATINHTQFVITSLSVSQSVIQSFRHFQATNDDTTIPILTCATETGSQQSFQSARYYYSPSVRYHLFIVIVFILNNLYHHFSCYIVIYLKWKTRKIRVKFISLHGTKTQSTTP